MRTQQEEDREREQLHVAQKRYTAQASAWVSATAARLHVEPEQVLFAIRCRLFPDDIDQLGSGLAFLTAIAGRSVKAFIPSSKFVADDEKAQMKREQKREQRKAA